MFVTPRSAEYFNEGGLRALIGHDKLLWPPTLIKELLDNSLDGCEATDTSPKIAVTVDADSFSVSDNGPGLPPETIKESLNYDTRISDKKWYITPTRGQLGSALKTLWPACFVSTGQRGVVEITACGVHHTVTVYGGEIKSHDCEKGATVKKGTSIRVHWPGIACLLTYDGQREFYRGSYAGRMDAVVVDVVRDFAAVNPHGTFSVRASGRTHTFRATDTNWKKWRACDRGSAHWCSVDDVSNLLLAHIREQGRLDELGIQHRRLTLRDVCGEFDGLKGTLIRKRVLEDAGLSGLSLDDVVEDVETVAGMLLPAMRKNSRKVKPRRLGVIGKPHLSKMLAAYGADKDVEYKVAAAFDDEGLPYVIEVAFGVRKERSRRMVFALNNSVVFQAPAENINDTLSACRLEPHDPVVLLVHATCPKFAFTSQGKNSLMMTRAMQNSLRELLLKVTGKFTKVKKSEEARRHHDAITDRHIEKLMERARVEDEDEQIKAAAFKFMAKAYQQASEPHNTAGARQVMYQCRPMVLAATGGKCWKNYSYFSKLLLDYQEQHAEECADWHIEYDARGHFREPHGGRFFGIGTAEARDYIDSWMDGSEGAGIESLHIESKFTTSGPLNRYQTAVYIEKEGFDDLINRSGIAQRYDTAIFSSKGMSVSAARKIVDEISQLGVTVFVLHDFDRAGMLIAHWLSHDSRRHEFHEQPNVIDIGLRLRDVERMKLESERVEYEQKKHPAERLREICEDVTEDEIDFLVSGEQRWNAQTQKRVWTGRRVELNAMTSRQFISFIERKLEGHGVKKVVPDRATLKIAWERAEKVRLINAAIDEAMRRINRNRTTKPAPRDLVTQVRETLRRHPEMPWDEALAQIADRCGSRNRRHRV
jgi:DNA topoisomerase VI subunit B